MACVGIPEKVPDGGAAVMPMDQPQPIGAAAGTAQQSVHRDAGLIGIFAVEIGGDDAALSLLCGNGMRLLYATEKTLARGQ